MNENEKVQEVHKISNIPPPQFFCSQCWIFPCMSCDTPSFISLAFPYSETSPDSVGVIVPSNIPSSVCVDTGACVPVLVEA